MQSRKLIYVLSLALTAKCAFAQSGTGLFQWQVSADNGATWQSGNLQVSESQPSVRVRANVSWNAPGIAFAIAGLDVVVEGLEGAGSADSITNILRPPTFLDGTPTNRVSVQRFGNLLKIDDSRDTSPPGTGPSTLWLIQTFNEISLNRDNPITILEYTLILDGSLGTRRLSEIFFTTTNGYRDNINRLFDVYTSRFTYNMPTSTRLGASVTVIPAPGASFFAAFGTVMIAARRRRFSR